MLGKNKIICIAGKNQCAIDCLAHVINKYKDSKILALPNKSDDGIDRWQKSFRNFSNKKNVQITNLSSLYKIKNLYLFSLEYEKILNVNKFISNKLYNFHFSLLPKYRGCHTNFYQIYNGEKISGVTLHKIDKGIDTGKIIDSISFNINLNATAYENYLKLLSNSVKLFKKNIPKVLDDNFISFKQNLNKGSYYSRESVNYKNLIIFDKIKNNINTHNKIRSLIFPPFQLPVYNGKKIKKSIFRNNKIKLIYV